MNTHSAITITQSGESTPIPANHPVTETTAMISMIERAARDPSVDIVKMQQLFEMQKEMIAIRAEAAFNEAMAQMQPKLPVIARNGRIEIKDKGSNKVIQSTKYALWEDINEAIVPILGAHGFSLTFKTGMTDDGRVKVTGELKHRDGHKEVTVMVLPHDSTGSKNAVQAIGSSTSYGKRYAAEALLNITSRGQDDDGVKGGAAGTITEEQVQKLQDLIIEVGADPQKFLRFIKLERLEDVRADKFNDAVAILNKKAPRS